MTLCAKSSQSVRKNMWAGQQQREAALITERHHCDVMERDVYVDTEGKERPLDNKESYFHGKHYLRH